MAQQKYSQATVREALSLSHGLIGQAAQRLGCSRSTVHNYIARYAALQDVVNDEREGLIDLAENGLRSKLQEEDPWAIGFTLRTLGQARGYIEKQQHDVSTGGERIRVVLDLGRADGSSPDDD